MGAIYTNYNWVFEENSTSGMWSKEENKAFERALAIYDEKTPDRFAKVAEMIPGKSVRDVMEQYKELLADVSDIENGLVPIPGYLTAPFTLELVDNNGFHSFRKGSVSLARPPEQERKKGVPWTEDEHRRFLLGLEKYGKGDWRNISRNFVFSKTPTQVASHAQKYFLRQNSGGKDKRRPSIHDITTANLSETADIQSETAAQQSVSLLDHSTSLPLLQKSITHIMPKLLLDWSNSNAEPFMVFNSGNKLCAYL